jgi:hypothetical protein
MEKALWVIASITNWVWKNSRSTGTARLVLLAIAHEADAGGNTTMSVLELARKSTLSERTAQTAARELERLGEIEVWARAGDHRRNGYRMIAFMGAGAAPIKGAGYAPKHSPKGADTAPTSEPKGAGAAPTKPDTSQVKPVKGADSAPIEENRLERSTTGRYTADVKPSSELARDDAERLCAHLADRIEANGSKRPNPATKRWRDAARLLLDADGRTEQQVHAAIDWCQDNEFWRSNILSMPKLREKYDQLRLRAHTERNSRRPTRQEQTDELFDDALITARELDAKETGNDPRRNGGHHQVRQSALPPAGD